MKENGDRLTLTTKLGYALGDFGGSLAFQTVTLFVVFYFTDVFGLSAAAAGGVFAIAKLWNAVCDPTIGALSDRVRTRFGQKRPFLLLGAVPLGVAFFLLVAAPSVEWKFAYAVGTFLFFSTAYSFVGVPYGAITASITKDPAERSSLTAYRMGFAILAILLVGGITKPIVGAFSSPQVGFRFVGVVYGTAAALLTWVTFFTTYEHETAPPEKTSAREMLGLLKGNAPFLLLSGAIILHLAAMTVVATLTNYYFKYNLHAESFTPVAYVSLFVCAAVVLPLWLFIERRIGKKHAFNAGMVIFGGSLLLLYALPHLSARQTIPIMLLAGVGMSSIYIFPWAMVPSTIDYSEWKMGVRSEGLLYGFFYFAFKASAALGGLVAGLGLELFGYTAQSGGTMSLHPDTLHGIRLLLTVVPTVLIGLGIGLIHNYPITQAMEEAMKADLDNRKTSGSLT